MNPFVKCILAGTVLGVASCSSMLLKVNPSQHFGAYALPFIPAHTHVTQTLPNDGSSYSFQLNIKKLK